MPPFLPQRRTHISLESGIEDAPPAKRARRTLPSNRHRTLQENEDFVKTTAGLNAERSLSDYDSDEFEDVSLEAGETPDHDQHQPDEDNSVDWEDAIRPTSVDRTPSVALSALSKPTRDLEIKLDLTGEQIVGTQKQKNGPTKRQRHARSCIHRMHVQLLLFHNLIRNGWCNDPEIHRILRKQLPKTVEIEIDKWRRAQGTDLATPSQEGQRAGRRAKNTRQQRDWCKPAHRMEEGVADMSRGDPLLRLLKVLSIYWRKRFVIIAPGLRRRGYYKSLAELKQDIIAWRRDPVGKVEYGEHIENLEAFRQCARNCEGSRDVGSQLFTALLRSIGIQARLIASLQPLGFGWTQSETARETASEKVTVTSDGPANEINNPAGNISATANCCPHGRGSESPVENGSRGKRSTKAVPKWAPTMLKDTKRDSNLVMGSVMDDVESDDDSVIDITPSTPRRKANQPFDDDMPAPTYWTEAISSITYDVIPVETFKNSPAVVTNAQHLLQFEPRGKRAERARQIFAYVYVDDPFAALCETELR